MDVIVLTDEAPEPGARDIETDVVNCEPIGGWIRLGSVVETDNASPDGRRLDDEPMPDR